MRVAGLLTLAALSLGLAAPGAHSASGPKITKVDPAAAIPGAAVIVKGTGLSGRGTAVTVGGKSAKVLSAKASELRVVVPMAKVGMHPLVVRRGKRRATARLRVVKPFRGRIGVVSDAKRTKSATIGVAGGSVTTVGADGTRYELVVPAGALATDHRIGVTPIARFSGLPFTGKALGADLSPDGLQFTRPVKLTITATSAFPAGSVGFGYASSTGVLDLQKPSGSGRTRVLSIEHFSAGAVAGSSPADFANAVAPLLIQQPMEEATIDRVLDLIAVYEGAFPPAFCVTQPACGAANGKSLQSLDTRVASRCANPAFLPAISAVRDLVRMEATRLRLGASSDSSAPCREQIMRLISDPAKTKACGPSADPLARRALIVNATLEEAGTSDLDGDGEVTHLEFLHFLIPELALANLVTMQVDINDCFFTTLDELPARGRQLCSTDAALAEQRLLKALRYARALANSNVVLQPFIDALDFCRLAVAIAPGTVSLVAGGQQQFTATVNNLLDPANNGVIWSATGGSINASGLYTAPSAVGTYEVKATSRLNPSTAASATVIVSTTGAARIGEAGGAVNGQASLNCNGRPDSDSDSDGETFTQGNFNRPWSISAALACPIFGNQSATGSGSGTQSISNGVGVTTITGSGNGNLTVSGNQKLQAASASSSGSVEFFVEGGPVNFAVSGSITATAPPQPSGSAGGRVQFGSFTSGLGAFSQSGTLQSGRYVFDGGASCGMFFSQTLNPREDLQCSYTYSYTLRLSL